MSFFAGVGSSDAAARIMLMNLPDLEGNGHAEPGSEFFFFSACPLSCASRRMLPNCLVPQSCAGAGRIWAGGRGSAAAKSPHAAAFVSRTLGHRRVDRSRCCVPIASGAGMQGSLTFSRRGWPAPLCCYRADLEMRLRLSPERRLRQTHPRIRNGDPGDVPARDSRRLPRRPKGS